MHHDSLTAADAIPGQRADSIRQTPSDWRALVLLRRATRALPEPVRRGTQIRRERAVSQVVHRDVTVNDVVCT